MSELIPFTFEGVPVRVIELDGEPWFVGKDVAERLGYADPTSAMKQHCKGVVKHHPLSTAGGMQEIRILSEPDVLRLIVGSKLPAAERFEKWVFEEILPTIRKTGSYGAARDPMEVLNDPAAMRGLLLTYSEKVIHLEAKVAETLPKAALYDAFLNADGLYGLQNAARALNLRPNLFIRWLKEKYLFYQGDTLVPYVQYRQAGIFEVKTVLIDDKKREQTYITPKGLAYLDARAPDRVRLAPVDCQAALAV